MQKGSFGLKVQGQVNFFLLNNFWHINNNRPKLKTSLSFTSEIDKLTETSFLERNSWQFALQFVICYDVMDLFQKMAWTFGWKIIALNFQELSFINHTNILQLYYFNWISLYGNILPSKTFCILLNFFLFES